MEIRILGPIEAYADGEALPLGGLRERGLLALFALSPGQTISTDRLIDELWGEDIPANPSNALQAVVSRLRRAVGSEAIVTAAPGYFLDVPPDAVDAGRFRRLVEAARSESELTVRRQLFRDALSLWHGQVLVEFPFEEFAQRAASALEEMRLSALEGRIAADLEAGEGPELVPELEQLVAAHPLRESLRASQMLALYRAGRQSEALRAYTAARGALGEELGIEPGPQLRALEEAILMQDPGLLPAQKGATLAPHRSTLPARLASFIGRESEMAEIAAAFATSRLVTLTGAGGSGKTSLAIEVARTRQTEYSDGVWLIELAPVMDPDLVATSLVAALQLEQVAGFGAGMNAAADPMTTVVEYLRERRALLILDNCEHVIDAATAVTEKILLACPLVEVLATSRERLGIPGELLWQVPPLGGSDGSSDAIKLFVERAQAVRPSFSPGPAEIDQIRDICAKLDGLPLAIELAAARVRSLPVREIAMRLDRDIGVLGGASERGVQRQKTLRGTIDWSYRLLTPIEADLFASLSVFRGSFSLESAEVVASPDLFEGAEVLDSLERLIDSSLVAQISIEAAGRYRMLETLRMYGREKLAGADAADAVIRRLLDYFLRSMSPAEDGLRGADQLAWLDRIDADHDTIRGVLDWAEVHAPQGALRLAGMLGWFWYLRGSGAEGRERLGDLLDAAGADADPRSRGDAHLFRGLSDPRPDQAKSGFEAALAAYTDAAYDPGIANAKAMIAGWGFEQQEGVDPFEEAARLAADAGYEWGVALVRFLQTGIASAMNDNATQARLGHEATSHFAALGDSWGQAYSQYAAGAALRAMGKYDEAEKSFGDALEHARTMRMRREMSMLMSELAIISMMRNNLEAADRWLADAQRYADDIPFSGSQGMVRNGRGRLAQLRGDLHEALQLHQEAVDLYEQDGSQGGLAYSHSCAGFTEEMLGNLDAARSHHHAALDNAHRTGDVFAIALGLEGVGATLIAAGDTSQGVALLSAGLAARELAGTPLPPGETLDVDRALEAATVALTPAALKKATQAGRNLGLEAAVDIALAD